ncbi:MAG: hypothetical protein WC806_01570 [Candidatus Gracilibacteria bacterium]|jgi:hypothetical protein
MGREADLSSIGMLAYGLSSESMEEVAINESSPDAALAIGYHESICSGEFPVAVFTYVYNYFSTFIEDYFDKNYLDGKEDIAFPDEMLAKAFYEDFPAVIQELLEESKVGVQYENLCILLGFVKETPNKIWPIVIAAYNDFVFRSLSREATLSQVRTVLGENRIHGDDVVNNGCPGFREALLLGDLKRAVDGADLRGTPDVVKKN